MANEKQTEDDKAVGSSESVRQLRDALALMEAGRAQDQEELKRCVSTLDEIASDREWMTRAEMVKRATSALLDVGAWSKTTKPTTDAFTA